MCRRIVLGISIVDVCHKEKRPRVKRSRRAMDVGVYPRDATPEFCTQIVLPCLPGVTPSEMNILSSIAEPAGCRLSLSTLSRYQLNGIRRARQVVILLTV